MTWPTLTATPSSSSVPAAGRLVIVTLANRLAGLSLGSVKPKSAAMKVWLPSSRMVIVLSVPAGASLTALMVIETVATLLSRLPSVAW